MSLLDGLIGIKNLIVGGVTMPARKTWRLVGVTAEDHPGEDTTDLVFGGDSGPSAIIVDRAIALDAFKGTRVISHNSIDVIYGMFGPPDEEDRPVVGARMLVFDTRPESSGVVGTGWYEVTISDEERTSLARLPGLTSGTAIAEGQVTVCRDASRALKQLGGGLGDGLGNFSAGIGVYEWVVNRAGTLASMAPDLPVQIVPAVEAALPDHTHDLASEWFSGFMSPEQATQVAELAASRPIVVDYVIRGEYLPGPFSFPDPDTIEGTGEFLPASTKVLLIWTPELTGWYDVTASEGGTWTMQRMEGLMHGEYVAPGRLTLSRNSGDAVYCWVTPGGVPIGYDHAELLPHPAVGSPPSVAGPIVVTTSIPSGALAGASYPDENTITGTGPFAPVGVTALIVAPYVEGQPNRSGWYVVTAADGSTWTVERTPGLQHGDTVPDGQVTVCRTVQTGLPPVTLWVTPIGSIGASIPLATPLPAAATTFGTDTPASVAATGSVGTADSAARSDHVHAQALMTAPPEGAPKFWWKLSEAGPTFPNSGSGGTLDMTVANGAPTPGLLGLFSDCMGFRGQSNGDLLGAPAGEGGLVGNEITMSCWVKPSLAVDTSWGALLTRQHNHTNWPDGFRDIGLFRIQSSSSVGFGIITDSADETAVSGNLYPLVDNRYNFLVGTWDGSVLKIYVNGELAGTKSLTDDGLRDMGANTRWAIGTVFGDSSQNDNACRIWDCRVYEETKDAAWVRAQWQAGINQRY